MDAAEAFMEILLTHGYFLGEDPAERRVMKPYPPLGLLYISSHLKNKGFSVSVFDSTFSSMEEFRRFVGARRPPVVGIYVNLITRAPALSMIRVCRQAGAAVVVGGPEPASYAEEYLGRGADVVVIGEGEKTLEELLPHVSRRRLQDLSRIQGIAFRNGGGQTVRTPPRPFIEDLDGQPFPDREAVDIPRYVDVWRKHHGTGSVSLITSRGCPYTCTWCSHSVFGYSHRARSPQNVADEVELIRDRYAPDMLWYADDVFTLNPRWFFSYAEELKRRRLVLPFETITREDRLNREIVKKLAEIRCRRIWIGAESGSQRILDAMQRRTDARRVREMVRLLREHGVQTGLFIMLGYEGERPEDLEATVEHLKQADPDVYLTTVAYPIKGTPYYEESADRINSTQPWEESSDRDLTVAGRPGPRYYRFATRWIRGEVALHQLKKGGGGRIRAWKAFANAKLGRLGMRLTD